MKLKALIIVLIGCLFMGITAISMGLGAAFPSINRIAKPLVCPNGTMIDASQYYRPYPGKTVMSRAWYCEDAQTQTKTVIGLFPMSIYAGCAYGLMMFALLLLIGVLKRRQVR